jgi:hypothetical protein
MNKFFTLICSWIVRKALLDPRCKEAIIDFAEIEEMMDKATERAIDEHQRDCEHLSSNEVEDLMENARFDYEEINGLEEFVTLTVKGEVEEKMEEFEELAEEIKEKIDSASNEIVAMTKLVNGLTPSMEKVS